VFGEQSFEVYLIVDFQNSLMTVACGCAFIHSFHISVSTCYVPSVLGTGGTTLSRTVPTLVEFTVFMHEQERETNKEANQSDTFK
jgi:hypothetical protein